jgi:hypothetical protein
MTRNEVYGLLLKTWNNRHWDTMPLESIGYWLVAIEDARLRAIAVHTREDPLQRCLMDILMYTVLCMMQHGGVKRFGLAPVTERIDATRYEHPIDVFPVINGERDYQDNLGPNRTDGSEHSVHCYLVMLSTYLRIAQDAWTNNPGVLPCLDNIRKIAAIVVHCLEGQSEC